jgi:hypothetical protein
MRKFAMILVGSVALTGVANAAPIYCSGTITNLYVDSAGNLILAGTWRNDYTMICQLHQTWNGIKPETCTFWYALLAASKTHTKNVLISYDTTYTCATLPTYEGTPAPTYVMQTS